MSSLSVKIIVLCGLLFVCNAMCYTTLAPDSAQRLQTMGFYNQDARDDADANYVCSFVPVFVISRIDTDSWYLDYERLYDIAVRKNGVPVELHFHNLFATTSKDQWEGKISWLHDRFAAGDRLAGLKYVVGPDEPFRNDYNDVDLNYALGLLKTYFPDSKVVCDFDRNSTFGLEPGWTTHPEPSNVDILRTTWAPFTETASYTASTFKSTFAGRLAYFRNNGWVKPMEVIGQSYGYDPGESYPYRVMPTSQQIMWYYEMFEDPAYAYLNVTGLYWYCWYSSQRDCIAYSTLDSIGSDVLSIGSGGTPKYADQLNQYIQIAKAIGKSGSPRTKPMFNSFDGSVVPGSAIPQWSSTDASDANVVPCVSSSSDGRVYTMESPTGTTVSRWKLSGPSDVWNPIHAVSTVETRTKFKATNSSTYAGGMSVNAGLNQNQFTVLFGQGSSDGYSSYLNFSGNSDQGLNASVKIKSHNPIAEDNFAGTNGLNPDSSLWAVAKTYVGSETLSAALNNGAVEIKGTNMGTAGYSKIGVTSNTAYVKSGYTNVAYFVMKFRYPSSNTDARCYGGLYVSPAPLNLANFNGYQYKFAGWTPNQGSHYFTKSINNTETSLKTFDSDFGKLSPDTDYWVQLYITSTDIRVRLSNDGITWTQYYSTTIDSSLASNSYYVTLLYQGKALTSTGSSSWFCDYFETFNFEPAFNKLKMVLKTNENKDTKLCDVYLNDAPTPVITNWIGWGSNSEQSLIFGDIKRDSCSGIIDTDYIAWTNGGEVQQLLLPGELDQNAYVNFSDFAVLAQGWVGNSDDEIYDLNKDGNFDFDDWAVLVNNWLQY